MISFRYHIVSIVAVFLGLALGVVIGTTGLNGAILDDLHKQVRDLRGENNSLRQGATDLRKTVDSGNQFAGTYGNKIVAGALDKVAVDLIVTPKAGSDAVKKVSDEITAAGGTVAATLTINSAYLDPSSRQGITEFVNGSAHPADLQLPTSTDAGVLLGATLAYVLAGKATATEANAIFSGLAVLHVATVSDGMKPATAAVMVTGGSIKKDDPRSTPMPALASELNQRGLKTVVAGDADSATAAGLVASVRNDSTLSTVISTVDNADSEMGQISCVLALSALLAGGESGQYGTGAKAGSVFPSPK